ncbi:MAG TPA: TetR/AcrR family transcriptional regulator [Sphingomonadaceae bacterium]|nr:TetR/AcrR family transcriptional regulator [Sphingomonadaceae bacterium]
MNTDSHFSVKAKGGEAAKDSLAPRQERSRQTAGKFVSAAMDLLHDKTFAELSVAELAKHAKRSVGVFYQRFGSKDDFLEVLLDAFFEESLAWRSEFDVGTTAEEVYVGFLKRGYESLRDNRNLWHAALERAAAEPDFWDKYHPYRESAGKITRAAIEKKLGRALTDAERRKVALAGQVFNSVINNQIINGPGPLMFEDDDFFPELKKIVLQIAEMPKS